MSVDVAIDRLWEKVQEFPSSPYLVTVSGEGRPHVVSVTARLDDRGVVVPAGTTTSANLAANPTATLLWSAPAGGDYCLIVDGVADAPEGDGVAISPTRAVLHRVVGAPTDLPGCITI